MIDTIQDIIRRIIGVILLREKTFEDIAKDPSATWQAAIIVTVVALLSAFSAAVSAAIFSVGFGAANFGLGLAENVVGDIGFRLPAFNGPVPAFFSTFFGAFASWLVWALVTWLIGEYIFKGDAGFAEMARVIGYAKVPQVIAGLGFIPGIGWLIRLIGWGWMLIATFVGLKTALELSNGKTILTILASGIVVFLVQQFIIDPIFVALF